MIKYLFFILITLLSGCTTDFSGLEKPEESVYIRFSSCANVQVGVDVSTRSSAEQPVGILGIGTQVKDTLSATLVGCDTASLRKWMKNDMYLYSPYSGLINHAEGRTPAFPIDPGSAVVAYAYMPYSDSVIYDEEDCYVPLDLVADSASIDWVYSGKTAKSKADYLVDQTFAFKFEHAMTRLDLVFDPTMTKINNKVEIVKLSLGIKDYGKGRLSLIDGKATKDVSSSDDAVAHCIQREPNIMSLYGSSVLDTVKFYLIPCTEIDTLRFVGVWNETDTITYESCIADSLHKWVSNKLEAGKSSVINLRFKKEKQ